MGKIVPQQHVTAEKGVVKFATYCANHNPIILFREESKHDYGIDGEVELTVVNEDGKTETLAEIIKVQLKSTKTKSYITKETSTSFEFRAESNDIEYWNRHILPVVLVVYFEEEDTLYAKKIEKAYVIKGRSKHNVQFDKQKHKLSNGTVFQKVVGQEFQSRINYNTTEALYSNFFKVFTPQYVRVYSCLFTEEQKIYDIIREQDLYPIPKFSLESNNFYCLEDINLYDKKIKESILHPDIVEKISFWDFIKKGKVERNIIVKIVNRYLKDFLYKKGIKYQKDYNRYYFGKFKEVPIDTKKKANSKREVFRYEKSKGKSGRYDNRAVVSKYTYYEKSSFFRHMAFKLSYEWIDNKLYLIIDPKYLYTEDGINPLQDKERITRLTNSLKQSERNTQYLNHLFFLRNFMNKGRLALFFHNNMNRLEIDHFEERVIPFGIIEDEVTFKVQESNQTNLFEDL